MKWHKVDTFPLSFRLDGHHHALLSERAQQFNLSPGQFARVLVRDALTDQHALETLHELSELKHHLQRALLDLEDLKSQLRAQRQRLRTATICLLTDAGRASLEAAQEFVDKHMAD
jgi:hypothetical protein